MISSNKDVKKQIISLYDMLACHEGYGELKVEFKILLSSMNIHRLHYFHKLSNTAGIAFFFLSRHI